MVGSQSSKEISPPPAYPRFPEPVVYGLARWGHPLYVIQTSPSAFHLERRSAVAYEKAKILHDRAKPGGLEKVPPVSPYSKFELARVRSSWRCLRWVAEGEGLMVICIDLQDHDMSYTTVMWRTTLRQAIGRTCADDLIRNYLKQPPQSTSVVFRPTLHRPGILLIDDSRPTDQHEVSAVRKEPIPPRLTTQSPSTTDDRIPHRYSPQWHLDGLPVEILTNIFDYLKPDEDRNDSLVHFGSSWTSLKGVALSCRRFHEILSNVLIEQITIHPCRLQKWQIAGFMAKPWRASHVHRLALRICGAEFDTFQRRPDLIDTFEQILSCMTNLREYRSLSPADLAYLPWWLSFHFPFLSQLDHLVTIGTSLPIRKTTPVQLLDRLEKLALRLNSQGDATGSQEIHVPLMRNLRSLRVNLTSGYAFYPLTASNLPQLRELRLRCTDNEYGSPEVRINSGILENIDTVKIEYFRCGGSLLRAAPHVRKLILLGCYEELESVPLMCRDLELLRITIRPGHPFDFIQLPDAARVGRLDLVDKSEPLFVASSDDPDI